ncbi:hypothetical protein CP02DC21_2120, partial [Chlamydia psittaci 02DC21]
MVVTFLSPPFCSKVLLDFFSTSSCSYNVFSSKLFLERISPIDTQTLTPRIP